MKREEPVVSVKKRIGMIVPAILLFLAGIAAAVVGFAVPDVAKYSMFFIGAGALAVVIGIFACDAQGFGGSGCAACEGTSPAVSGGRAQAA